MSKCKHHRRLVVRNVQAIITNNRLRTGVRISGGKNYILMPVVKTATSYSKLIYCAKCEEVLEKQL
jgi:hypothetical protein